MFYYSLWSGRFLLMIELVYRLCIFFTWVCWLNCLCIRLQRKYLVNCFKVCVGVIFITHLTLKFRSIFCYVIGSIFLQWILYTNCINIPTLAYSYLLSVAHLYIFNTYEQWQLGKMRIFSSSCNILLCILLSILCLLICNKLKNIYLMYCVQCHESCNCM